MIVLKKEEILLVVQQMALLETRFYFVLNTITFKNFVGYLMAKLMSVYKLKNSFEYEAIRNISSYLIYLSWLLWHSVGYI